MGHALAIRSDVNSLFQIGLLSNKSLLGAVALTFILQLAVVYVPALQQTFKTAALSASELLISLLVSTIVFSVVELNKWRVRRFSGT
jgi:Ca2+-transporting ATPase